MSHDLTNAADIKRFALAGKAHLTLTSAKTGVHFTFRITEPEDRKTGHSDMHFVSVLCDGSADDGKFLFLGCIFPDRFVQTKGSKVGRDAPSVKAFTFFWNGVLGGHIHPDLRVQHEGRCGRCGRTLTEPVSIDIGIGPECRSKMGIAEPVADMVRRWVDRDPGADSAIEGRREEADQGNW